MDSMSPNVISTIVKNDLCIGWGVCAVLCPDHSLTMQFNLFGEYNPVEEKECSKECGICLKACPFADCNDNEDAIGKMLYGNVPGICHSMETGYFLDTYVGYAPDTRERGSSGGMATWFLSTLLKKRIVDFIIAVIPNENPNQLFKFSILTDIESVLNSSGSAYYPIELSGVLNEIQNKPGRCAIIGLPCFIKAIRLVCQKNKKLNEKILITIGIVCGQLKSKHYTEYISVLSGVIPPLKKVHYRGKSSEKPASNYYFSSMSEEGQKGEIFWKNGVAEAWTNRWFTPNACNYCDDVFSECADVAFMDAWLPEYSSDYKGTNLVLVRSAQVQKLIIDGIESGEINLKIIPIQKVIESQPAGIVEKRINLAYRLFLSRSAGIVTPKKRIEPMKITNPFQKKKFVLKDQMRNSSKTIWSVKSSKGLYDLEDFRERMDFFLSQILIWNRLSKIFIFPRNACRVLRKKIRGFCYG